jgi:hypothetical protein
MPLSPEEFVILGTKFRHQPLAAFPLARAYDELVKRLDQGTGTLDLLTFTLTAEDHSAMTEFSMAGILLWIKSLASALGEDKLDVLCQHYLELGSVEMAASVNGVEVWIAMQTEQQAQALPNPAMMFVCVWHVLRGLVRPFSDLLPSFTEKVKARKSGSATSPSEATDEPAAPISASES